MRLYKHFTRTKDGYEDDDGNTITTDFLMEHPHQIWEDDGYVAIDSSPVEDIVSAKNGQWISVKDKLPTKEGDYIAYSSFVEALYYQDSKWKDYTGDEIVIVNEVTHWMPLPEIPK